MALVFYYKDILEKVTMQRTRQFSAFSTQLNAVHAQLLVKLRPIAFAETCQFPTIQSLEFQEIWQKNSSETAWMIYHKKTEFWHREFLIIQNMRENDLRRITKIVCVKILLEQCWQKGFNVNS